MSTFNHTTITDDIIRRGMRAGIPASEIATWIGTKSRNVVLGRWRRLQEKRRKELALQTERAKVHTPRGGKAHAAYKTRRYSSKNITSS